METVAAVFSNKDGAFKAVERLRREGMPDKKLAVLTPGATEAELAKIPTADGEQPGIAPAIGAAVGTGMGAHLGAAATILLPGAGAVTALGYAAIALFGLAGAAAGAAVGKEMQDNLEGELPRDELYVYEDALRHGRSVVIAMAEDGGAERARRVFDEFGAESVDAAREQWWVGLRDAEEEEYRATGGDFRRDEPIYRKGFEAALRKDFEGRDFGAAHTELRRIHPDCCDERPFRHGYDRGRKWAGAIRAERGRR